MPLLTTLTLEPWPVKKRTQSAEDVPGVAGVLVVGGSCPASVAVGPSPVAIMTSPGSSSGDRI